VYNVLVVVVVDINLPYQCIQVIDNTTPLLDVTK